LKENLSENVLETTEIVEEKVQSAPIRIPTTQTDSFEDSTPAIKLIPEKPKTEVRKEEVEPIKKDPVVSLFDVPDGNWFFF